MRTRSYLSPRHPVPWTPRDVWIGVVCLALLQSVAVGVFLLLRLTRQGEVLLINEVLLLSLELLLVVPVGYVAFWKYHVGWETVGFRTCPYEAIRWGGRALLWFYTWSVIYSLLLMLVHVRMPNYVVVVVKRFSPWFVLLAGAVLGPFLEELFFRGFVFAGLHQRYSLRTAAIVSAALFALIHLQWLLFVPLFVLGYLLADLYERSDSLWPPIVMHSMINTLALGVASLKT